MIRIHTGGNGLNLVVFIEIGEVHAGAPDVCQDRYRSAPKISLDVEVPLFT